jgi:hypothetical protein
MKVGWITDGNVRSGRPLAAGFVLIDRPDETIRVSQGKLAPTPALICGIARDAQDGPLIHAVRMERVDIGNLELEMNSYSDARVRKLFSVRFLGMKHDRELPDPQDCQAVWCAIVLGVNLDDFGTDDLVIELKRPANVLDVQKDARDTGRHSNPLSATNRDDRSRVHLPKINANGDF